MKLYSTQNPALITNLREAVMTGLAPDNGLYLPVEIPQFSGDELASIIESPIHEIGYQVSRKLIGNEVPEQVLMDICGSALNFPVELTQPDPSTHFLELFHGPTLAFKDFGARYMARLLSWFNRNESDEINILVATSGDTGSAVGSGFRNVEGIRVTILYPKGKISNLQEQQITTIGDNVSAIAVEGTFDDCQRLVKQAFLDTALRKQKRLSSANSINISRLIPQSFYYFYAYGNVTASSDVVFSVPSGNLGNLCGGILAEKMGLPVHAFIASTNRNHVFPDYLDSGTYKPAPSVPTLSNAMDVGAPSNFERILHLFNSDHVAISKKIKGYWFDDEQTLDAIKNVFKKEQYVMCPHTAIGFLGLKEYRKQYTFNGTGIVLSTAHPVKFREGVRKAVGEVPVPDPIKAIMNKEGHSTGMENSYEQFREYLLGR